MAVWTDNTSTGEVRVETGTGLITELKHEHGKRNAQMIVKATHHDLRDPVTGWIDTADSGVWDIAQQAFADHFEIDYRIEVHRKADVDKTKPLKELGNREKVRDVAALARKGELSEIDRTPPADSTPVPETPPHAPAPPAAPQQPQRRPRVAEAKPWELYNSDGSLNLGCWSFQAASEFMGLAHKLVGHHNTQVGEETGTTPEFRLPPVAKLAATLLDAADQVQANIRPDGRHDRLDNSHVRARWAIRDALYQHPVPWGSDGETRQQWLEQLVAHATEILHLAVEIFRFHETGDPR